MIFDFEVGCCRVYRFVTDLTGSLKLKTAFLVPIDAERCRQVPIAAERDRVYRRLSAPIGTWRPRLSEAIGGNPVSGVVVSEGSVCITFWTFLAFHGWRVWPGGLAGPPWQRDHHPLYITPGRK